MKRTILCFIITLLLFAFFGCSNTKDEVISSLPDYKDKVSYGITAGQDYIYYGKCFYENITEGNLQNTGYFTKTTESDIEEILLYIEDFKAWVDASDRELKDNYDFDNSIISQGDYFYIYTKAGEPIGDNEYSKFDTYCVYYFDIDTQILYYFDQKN